MTQPQAPQMTVVPVVLVVDPRPSASDAVRPRFPRAVILSTDSCDEALSYIGYATFTRVVLGDLTVADERRLLRALRHPDAWTPHGRPAVERLHGDPVLPSKPPPLPSTIPPPSRPAGRRPNILPPRERVPRVDTHRS